MHGHLQPNSSNSASVGRLVDFLKQIILHKSSIYFNITLFFNTQVERSRKLAYNC